MSDPFDSHLEALLGEELRAELGPHLGRAEAAFIRHTRPAAARAPRAFHSWALGLAGAALAASLAGLWAGPSLRPARVPLRPTGFSRPAPLPDPAAVASAQGPESTLPTVREVRSRTWDEGTVVFDNRIPARRVHREELERTQWYDPERRARVEMVLPHEDVKFVEMDTY